MVLYANSKSSLSSLTFMWKCKVKIGISANYEIFSRPISRMVAHVLMMILYNYSQVWYIHGQVWEGVRQHHCAGARGVWLRLWPRDPGHVSRLQPRVRLWHVLLLLCWHSSQATVSWSGLNKLQQSLKFNLSMSYSFLPLHSALDHSNWGKGAA